MEGITSNVGTKEGQDQKSTTLAMEPKHLIGLLPLIQKKENH